MVYDFSFSYNSLIHDLLALDDGTQLVTTTFRGFDRFHTTAILLLRNPFISLVAAKQDPDGTLGIITYTFHNLENK